MAVFPFAFWKPAPVSALGTIAIHAKLGDPGQAATFTSSNAWTTVLSKAITVLGAASALDIVTFWNAFRTGGGGGTIRYRLRVDGVVVGVGASDSLDPSLSASATLATVFNVAAGVRTVDLQAFGSDANFAIDPTNGARNDQAAILVREVPR
jgi:hypothetical protein